MAAALSWVMQVLTNLWNAFLKFISVVIQFGVDIITALLNLAVDSFFWILLIAVSIIPEVPSLPGQGSIASQIMNVANYFFPLAELLQALTFIGVVYGAIGLYKLAKFIRGGG